ncbi:MAG TPA: hypothetical protein DD437_16300 [Rhodobiaceae bacterium]|nr:hypothetical protein [Rhodobiaceae bacterium]
MAKLDIVGTVTESYKGAWSHFGDMVKLVWAPVVVYIAANVLHSLSVQSITQEIDPSDVEAMFQASWGWQAAAVTLLGLFLWPIIAVAWHRFILLGETSSSALYFKFGRREARFMLTSIFLSLLVVPGVLVMIVGAGTALSAFAIPVGLVLMVAGLAYALRLSLLLPAVATDAAVDARAILDATQDNVLRIFGAHTLNILALLAVAIGFSILIGIVALVMGPVIGIIGGAVLGVFAQIISVAILSVMYRDLVLSGQSAASPPDSQVH